MWRYWNPTEKVARYLFGDIESVKSVSTVTYGCKDGYMLSIYGVAVEKIDQDELRYRDDDHQPLIGVIIRKDE